MSNKQVQANNGHQQGIPKQILQYEKLGQNALSTIHVTLLLSKLQSDNSQHQPHY